MNPTPTKINASHIAVLICGILLGAIPVAYTARNDAKFHQLRERMYKYHLLKLINEIEQIEDANEASLVDLKETAGQIKSKFNSQLNDSNEVKP
jgi:hypothetical protein